MKVAIMQPYFFPYIGYFQLIRNVDTFVIYDNIEYTKKGWINRNRIFVNGKAEYITLPLKKESDYLYVKDRSLAATWDTDKRKMLNKIKEAYRKAPFFSEIFPIIEDCINYKNQNLFEFIKYTLESINHYVGISTPLIISSSLSFNEELKGEEKVIAICKAVKATEYINPIGGTELYSKENFLKEGIKLKFLKVEDFDYNQFNYEFIPFLSIIDVLMFNSKEHVMEYLTSKTIIG